MQRPDEKKDHRKKEIDTMHPLTENCQIYRGSLFVQHPDSRLAKAYEERARAVSAATVSGITAVPKALFFPTHFLED